MQTLYNNGSNGRGDGRQRVKAKAQAQHLNVAALGAGFEISDRAVVFCNQILRSFERAACEADPALQQSWLTFAIVGGGATGFEFATRNCLSDQ